MYNKVKKILGLVAGIIGIVIGAFSIIAGMAGAIDSLIWLADGFEDGLFIGGIIIGLAAVGFGIALIVVGAKLCKAPRQVAAGVWANRKGLFIGTIVVSALYLIIAAVATFAIYGELSWMLYYYSSFGIELAYILNLIGFIFSFAILGLIITCMCLKTVVPAKPGAAQPAAPATYAQPVAPVAPAAPAAPVAPAPAAAPANKIDDKIKQLTQLKDMGAITEEQYQDAVKKLVSSLID